MTDLLRSIGLRGRVLSLLSALLAVTLAGGGVMIWYTYEMDTLMDRMANQDVTALVQTEEMRFELSMQKGYVSYYFMTGDEQWLDKLEEHRRLFRDRLDVVRGHVGFEDEKTLLGQIETDYNDYVRTKDQVIAYYKVGAKDKGEELHEDIRPLFFKVVERCEQFTELHKNKIQDRMDQSRAEAARLRLVAAAAMTGAATLGLLLAYLLLAQILEPIRHLTLETTGPKRSIGGNEIADLTSRVHGLIHDADATRVELAKSREMLFLSEKLAVVGKLAADVAHSIRNPMTSIKMRLFSLERSLELTPIQKEDFQVVAEEMRRLDNIVRNFLEFSRPPKLTKRQIDLARVLDTTVELLAHRLELGRVEVELSHHPGLPLIEADPELLKEVLVNFIVNACEAMEHGGNLRIAGEPSRDDDIGPAVRVTIADTGPGVPEDLWEKVFEPFFSTKEDGTGLGLSIALRIIEQHGGRLEMTSREDEGTTFTIILPAMEENP